MVPDRGGGGHKPSYNNDAAGERAHPLGRTVMETTAAELAVAARVATPGQVGQCALVVSTAHAKWRRGASTTLSVTDALW
jgi:hypothetical protein